MLADQVMWRIDARIGGLCRDAGLIYTRYVDDLTISGAFISRKAVFPIGSTHLDRTRLQGESAQNCFGRLADGVPITKIRVKHGHLDVRKEYIEELERQIADASALATGGDFQGPYFTESQIWGRVQFVCWINRGRRPTLLRKFRASLLAKGR